MAQLQLTLSEEERDCLQALLEVALKEARVEEHRTRTPRYREGIIHREELLDQMLRKVREPVAARS